jgi:hypothetical protein
MMTIINFFYVLFQIGYSMIYFLFFMFFMLIAVVWSALQIIWHDTDEGEK